MESGAAREYNGSMKFFSPCFIILVVVALIAIAAVISMYYERKRREALEKVAGELGLDFFPQGIPGLLGVLQGFKLVSAGDSHTVMNTIRGDTGDVELTIFDLSYCTGSGKNRSTHRQTVVRFTSSQLNLPDFAISPEGFFQFFAKLFGTKDINFAEDPQFSSAFLLQGAHEGAVRQLFGPELRAWFSERKGVTSEGRGSQLLFFRAGQRVNPDKIAALLEEGFQLFKLLAKPAGLDSPS